MHTNPISIPENINEYSGIPLTTELLKNCGFSYNKIKGVVGFDESDETENTYYLELPIKKNKYCDSFCFTIVKWGDKGDFTFSNHNLRIKLNYLHQLQNLFRVLTGTELLIHFEK